MKRLSLLLLALVVLVSPSLQAQGGPPPHAGQGQHRGGPAVECSDELPALERFLSMNDGQLDQLQKAIAKVRAMTPEERKALRQKMADYGRLPADQREQVKIGWGWQSDADRTDWPLMMRTKTDAERGTIQADIKSLAPEQRAARKHALLETWRATNPDRH